MLDFLAIDISLLQAWMGLKQHRDYRCRPFVILEGVHPHHRFDTPCITELVNLELCQEKVSVTNASSAQHTAH